MLKKDKRVRLVHVVHSGNKIGLAPVLKPHRMTPIGIYCIADIGAKSFHVVQLCLSLFRGRVRIFSTGRKPNGDVHERLSVDYRSGGRRRDDLGHPLGKGLGHTPGTVSAAGQPVYQESVNIGPNIFCHRIDHGYDGDIINARCGAPTGKTTLLYNELRVQQKTVELIFVYSLHKKRSTQP